MLGLEGHEPNRIDPDIVPATLERIRGEKALMLGGVKRIGFEEKRDLAMNKRQKLPFHTTGMRFTAFDADDAVLATRDYYSVGGGFVVNPDEAAADRIVPDTTPLPYPFHSGDELLAQARDNGLSIARIMFANEEAWRSPEEIRTGLREIWSTMQACVARGIRAEGNLPGGLHVSRRAPALYHELLSRPEAAMRDPLTTLDWVNLYALAVNEENAAGRRVVTRRPTCRRHHPGGRPTTSASSRCERTGHFRLPAHRRSIGILCRKTPASPVPKSAVRARSAWPARWPPADPALGGTPRSRERREIGVEHNLGLTCDPIAGLVQIPASAQRDGFDQGHQRLAWRCAGASTRSASTR